jgi:hypothetical protein
MDDAVEKTEKPPGRLMIVLAVIVLFGAWLVFLHPLVKYQFWQSDTYWLIEVGRLILDKQCLPTQDPYSFTTTGHQWIIYQWLSEVILALANKVGGLTGVAVFGEVLLAVLFCFMIFRKMLSQGANAIVAVVVIWMGAYGFYADIASLRPQLFSFVLFWLLLVLCQECKSGLPLWKALIQTFIISVVWANCHVSFPIAMFVLGPHLVVALFAYWRKTADRRLPILFGSIIATFFIGTLVTPYGVEIWTFIFNAHNLYWSQEVEPLDWSNQPRLIRLTILTFFSCAYLRKKLDAADLLALLGLLAVGLDCGRLIIYFCIFSCQLNGTALTQLLRPLLNQNIPRRLSEAMRSVALSRFYLLGIVLLAAFCVMRQPLYLRRNVPLQAIMYLADHPLKGNMFCTAHSGGYLLYKSRGAIPVFVDTRIDLYETSFFNRFVLAIERGQGWKELFAEYKITSALLPNDSGLKPIIDKQPDWKRIYQDHDFSLYVQKDAN